MGTRRLALAAGLIGLLALPALGQSATDDLKQEIEQLKKGQEEIQKQLAEIKRLLQARPAAPTAPPAPATNVKDVVFNLGDNLVRGASTAKLTLIEFSDYQ